MASHVPTIEDLLKRNKAVAQAHKAFPQLGSLPNDARPLPKILIVSCADPRCDPGYLFALKQGEAISLRNIGGRVETMLGDVISMDSLIGFRHVLVVHHTDCGATFEPAASVRKGVNKLPGADGNAVGALTLPNFDDDEQSLRDDIAFLKESPFLRKELAESVQGFLFDISTGLLRTVV